MEEQATLDPSLENIISLICNGDMVEIHDFIEHSSPCQSIVPGSQVENNQVENNQVDKMSSLLELNFNSRDDLLAAVHKCAFKEGFATVTRRSKLDKCVYIGCDRGGNYRDTRKVPIEMRKRETSSRLVNCPFEIVGRRKAEGFWKVDIKNSTHNHEPSRDMSGHPYSRRFSKEDIVKIKEMSKAGVSPRQIMSSLRQSNPDLQAIAKTIYNEKHRIMKENLAGRTIIQALLEELGQAGFRYDIEYDLDGRLTHLMFAHPLSIALTKSYTNVFVIVKEKICLAIENQFHEIKAQLSSERIRHPHRAAAIPFFKELITHISIFALDQLHKQYELARSSNLSSQCRGNFYRSMGLPCAHMIKESSFEALQLDNIHDQWRIDARVFDHGASLDDGDEIDVLLSEFKTKYERMPLTQKDNTKRKLTQFLGASLPLLLEPTIQPHKGRPLGSKNKKDFSF